MSFSQTMNRFDYGVSHISVLRPLNNNGIDDERTSVQ